MNDSLTFSQKLYLLGIHPQKGGLVSSAAAAMDNILIGSLLLELYKEKNIDFVDKRVVLLNPKSNVPIHRFMLEKLSNKKRNLKISTWLGKFAYSIKYIRNEVRQNLTDKRMIRMVDKRFLFLKWKKPFLTNKQVVYRMVDEIDSWINKGTSEEDNLILLSFIEPSGLLYRLYADRKKRKNAKQKLKKMRLENQVSKAVSDAITAAAVVASTVAVSAATTSS